MHFARLRSWLFVSCAAAILTAGCGEGHSLSPTAPTALPDSSVSSIDGDADAFLAASTGEDFAALGNGKGSGGGSSNSGGGKGSGTDTDRSDKGKGGKGKDGTAEVEVDHDDDDADDEEDDDGEDNHGRRRSVVGFVSAVGDGSITVRGIVVTIMDTTVIRHGHRRLTIADIHVGDHAQAKGTMSADGTTLTAVEVKVEDTGNDNDDEDDDADKVEVKGAVGGLTGTCPALTFTVGTTTVKTDAHTAFDDVTCAALVNGNTVEVEGQKQADHSVLASKVELESGPNEVEGRIAGLTGTCPSLTFTIGTTTVTTSSATTFSGVACTALANNAKVEVEGTLTGTTLAAVWIELD